MTHITYDGTHMLVLFQPPMSGIQGQGGKRWLSGKGDADTEAGNYCVSERSKVTQWLRRQTGKEWGIFWRERRK